ncbi:MAG: insulinase family protein, partial [Cyclobacteriaceae bacterium]|nr:insulinase family protein [Cyclobacteriaceae bacterium]
MDKLGNFFCAFLISFLIFADVPSANSFSLKDGQTENENEQIPLNPNVKFGKLENGLTYYIMKNSKPEDKVELRLAINAGSIQEDDNQLGLAHFMEHMNFNGTKNFKKNELVDYLQSVGVKFGAHLNAYTSFDETVYMLSIPSDDQEILNKGFLVLEDWAHNANLTEEEIDKERGVVLEEYRIGLGAGKRMLNNYLPKVMYGSKYADRLPIGTKDILENFDYDVIRKYYKDWYRPDLMAVIAVGDIDP